MLRHLRSGSVVAACVLLAPLLGACPSGGGGAGGRSAEQGAVVREEFCNWRDLQAPLRQTVVVIDERSLAASEEGRPIRETNQALFDLVSGLGNPSVAIRSGAMAAREQLTIFIAPTSGAAPRLIFSGCLPGVSDQEQAEIDADQSGLQNSSDAFWGHRAQQDASQEQDGFYSALLGALSQAANQRSDDAGRRGPFLGGSLLESLTAVRQLTPEGTAAPRLFILTDLRSFAQTGDVSAARTAGFTDARTAGLKLGGVEVYLVADGEQQGGTARDYADAFFLGSQGDLMSWGGATFSALTAPPATSREYAGSITYPHDQFPMVLRLAADSQGRLVNSWVLITSDAEWATPVSGSLSCSHGECQLTSDRSGFAQVWSINPDPNPEFLAEMPLSGLRTIEATVTDDTVVGAVSDPIVSIFEGAPEGFNALRFNLTRHSQPGTENGG